uniref:Uncharacterized protein n=1 Tax=Ditylenchus dipsaci TaxID=166011 RepID=A0A915CKT3_9BILA
MGIMVRDVLILRSESNVKRRDNSGGIGTTSLPDNDVKELACPNAMVPLIFAWTMTFLLLILAIVGVSMSLVGCKRRIEEEKAEKHSGSGRQKMPIANTLASATIATTPAQSPLVPQ